MSDVVGRAAELGLPVLFDAYSPTDPGQPGKFVELAQRHPSARIVLAHMQFTRFLELLVYEVLARYPSWTRNVWFDMSATGRLFADSPCADQFGWVCRKLGTDRLLWASDFPMDDPADALRALDAYGFDEGQLRQICHDNAVSLFGLDHER